MNRIWPRQHSVSPWWVALLACGLVGCPIPEDPAWKTDIDTDTDTVGDDDDDDTQPWIDTDDTADPNGGLFGVGSTADCANVYEYDNTVVGTLYWVGDWTKTSATRVEGREYLVLYANPFWQDGCNGSCTSQPGEDCIISYDSAGDVVEASNNCPLCEYGIAVTAVVNRSETTCPEAMWSPDRPTSDPDFYSWSLQYDIDERDDGTSEVRWTSGNTLGEGVWSSSQLTYLTEADCKYF